MMTTTKLRAQVDTVSTVVPPPPSRFTLDEWYVNNRHRYRCSETQQQLAERLLAECDRIRTLTEESARSNKEEVDYRLEEKVKDIEFRKKELLNVRKEVLHEVDALGIYKERLMDALSSVKCNALVICQKCLIVREHRLGIDLARDDVERELRKECEVIRGAEDLLVRTLEQTHEQTRRLKATLYYMDHDLEDKDNNLRIDRHNRTLTDTSLNLALYHGNARLDPSSITLSEWEMQTNTNIVKASKEINSARPLRCYIDTILKQIIDDLNVQKQATDEAFRSRIDETKSVKMKLELQHSEIMRQANEMTRNITRLEKSIAEKEKYMALAHTRLGNRCQRPGLELCRDMVETSLVEEVYDLRGNVSMLQRMFNEAQASLRYLLRTQIQLEEDINVKANTLKIDEVDCMTLRQSMSYHAY
ncbi:tektin-1 [Neodiprion pinetum]|uniref:Tektin n=1 Tax=Neodiprion lecontei TaxID=441921 RepID=A0A6J0BKW7_NEOLC|nr:tektin-1 [Neodiprion lecontei]XP_046426022.1 tektin-1 [Neodiprion fabricii]XP_046426023.1 tektin-1 [Neodiprion fabricii]XP_046426024.1 tektin-1 [Neodiprion fabricii]XP_046483861.1 tektin-1 [Neodiprion pinetum]XP_046483862.1 tektin-1 [Neodiprion pinetum]XP_046483863.1 tektin-1 [Neodiprion pinetum]XP_046596976.1 tektin-1 [Neodiprion lecontei]XP_046596977.1 tektin-1 [Neodiprion lecontei]XP_046620026.1 tektin-1 [Neodiprion virginianus]XP_046620027.1 tektin-1 [Neodiprion virginianus]XP_046